MTESHTPVSLDASLPEHGGAAPGARIGPRALFSALAVESAEHLEYLAPAFHFARAALAAAPLSELSLEVAAPDASIDALLAWARAQVQPLAADDYGSSWPARVVREFAPVGLTDGAWLSGGLIERGDAGARTLLRAQLAARLGADDAHESHARRYGLLLASLGVPLQSITRWEFDETPQCADISYEHGLLGLTLGLFPSWFAPETLGFELWMAAIGPCPLLDDLREELGLREACARYLDCYPRASLTARARALVAAAIADEPSAAARVLRGFCAAHASYQRWAQGMKGANVPYTPRDFVLEGVRRKARFAIDHHHEIELKGRNLAELLRDGGAAHELLLDHLAETASLVKPGAPDHSPLMTHALSLEGPMFDAFTATEKNDLREWIAGLGRPQRGAREPVPLAGAYVGAADHAAHHAELAARYEALPIAELTRCLAEEDRHPGARITAIRLTARWCEAFTRAFAEDARLAAYRAPAYAPRAVRALAEDLRTRGDAAPVSAGDRGFLRGVIDVGRVEFEEYGLLLQRYLAAGPHAGAPRDPRWELLVRGLSLGTRRFLPELLGLNLGLEQLAGASDAASERHRLLAVRAVQGYFDRVAEAMPDELERLWQRVHAAARLPRVIALGSAAERAALVEHFLAHEADAFALDALLVRS